MANERDNHESDFNANSQTTKKSKSRERAAKDDSDSSVDALFSSLYSNLHSTDESDGKSVNSNSKHSSSNDAVEREFFNFINSLANDSQTIERKNATSDVQRDDQEATWSRMMQGALGTRPQLSEDDLSSTLLQSSSESMTPMYSSIPYSIPIPMMMQVPVSPMVPTPMDKKSPSGGNCFKMVDTCKEDTKEKDKSIPDVQMMITKYSNEATGGSKKRPDSNQQPTSECGDKRNFTSVVNKMEDVMKKTMKNYVDKMMSVKVEKAMKSAMSKMKASTSAPSKSRPSGRMPYSGAKGSESMMNHMSPPMTVESNYMTDIMMGMMNLGNSRNSKCPCQSQTVKSKTPAPPKKQTPKDEKEDREDKDDKDDTDDASYDDTKGDDEAIDEGFLMKQVKEVMGEVIMDAMKETMNQVALESY